MINRIREWAQTDELILSKNRALVFPTSESTDFGVLDKNKFYRIILNSTAFIKTFGKHDILVGKNLVLGIRRFRILQAEDSKYMKTDKFGDRYRYVLELENGSREFFTYSDAFLFLQRTALLEKAPENVRVLRKTFKVRELKKIPLQIEDELRDIRRFGIEVIFDGPILMSPDRFPFQIVEQKMRDPETGRYKAQFFLQIIFYFYVPHSPRGKNFQALGRIFWLLPCVIVVSLCPPWIDFGKSVPRNFSNPDL